ncbi:MAG TPA: hypothetical protein VF612_09150 [Jatrophihabitans sp.]|jgi:hypothetical protein|uniref:hypothetical protein n=1 Tax=Jatrophihabitans sp. TaxID=1932789 RepID=UPI002EEB662E
MPTILADGPDGVSIAVRTHCRTAMLEATAVLPVLFKRLDGLDYGWLNSDHYQAPKLGDLEVKLVVSLVLTCSGCKFASRTDRTHRPW